MTRSALSPLARLATIAAVTLSLLATFLMTSPGRAEATGWQTTTIVTLVNEARVERGMEPLRVNADLTAIAQDWSERQAAADVMSHRPSFSSGYPSGWTRAAENVAWHSDDDPQEIFTAWMDSAGHRANILNPDLTDIGVGWAHAASGRHYATQNFAAYPGTAAVAPAAAPATALGDHDYTGDGNTDVLAVTSTGTLMLYPGDGRGGWQSARTVGSGWSGYDIIAPGDFTGDHRADLLAIAPGGRLYLYPGTGNGFAAKVWIGRGWQHFTTVLSPGDFSGDGHADVIAIAPSGDMRLYYGTGSGRLDGSDAIGHGWDIYTDVLPGGDFNGDGRADIFAKDSAGLLFAYYNRGDNAMTSRTQIGSGWTDYHQVASVGDFSGDGATDLFAVNATTGHAYLYPGNGHGAFTSRSHIGTGWNVFTTIR